MISKISANLLVKYWRVKEGIKDFFQEERGDSTIIAVILVIVIVVGLALVFRDKITEIVSNLWASITNSTKDFNPDSVKNKVGG